MPTVFITGANRGIGLELARLYASKNYLVIAGVRLPHKSDEISNFAEVVQLEVTNPASVAMLENKMASETIDVLINNAGIIGPDRQTTTDMDFDGFAKTLAINTLGPLRVTQALVPSLKRAKAGKVATLTSNMGTMSSAMPDHVAYRASKAAANKVMQCLATDLKPMGIAVAAMHPGWVRTEMGGSHADISVEESARGLYQAITQLSLKTTGKFLNYDGTELAW